MNENCAAPSPASNKRIRVVILQLEQEACVRFLSDLARLVTAEALAGQARGRAARAGARAERRAHEKKKRGSYKISKIIQNA